jgi:hypothetical protein
MLENSCGVKTDYVYHEKNNSGMRPFYQPNLKGVSIMFFIRSCSIAAICVVSVFLSVYSAEQKPALTAPDATSDALGLIDESDWGVYMDAPAYHFKLAKEYLQKGDKSKAASELKRGNTFLSYQKNRISFAIKQIEELSKSIATGKEKDTSTLDAVTSKAMNILDRKYVMIPAEIEGTSIFGDEYKYHFDNAKLKLRENNPTGAASEIRRAASFLRLKAAHMKHIAKTDIDAMGNELKELASKVESGAIKDIKDLDQAFIKAISIVFKKKE